LKEFETRLRVGREALKLENIKVYRYKADDLSRVKPKSRPQVKDTEGRSHIDPHRWLTIMDTFANGIDKLFAPTRFPENYFTHPSLPGELQKEVRVALIDDGANFMHKAIASKLENGRSFDSGYGDPDLSSAPAPFHGSTTGHGTYMAYMIGRVCPAVKIFVCKLDVARNTGTAKANFTAKSAADVSLIHDR
jgi:hypothetical protein